MNILKNLITNKQGASNVAIAGVVGVCFGLLNLLPEDAYIRTFFLNGWYIQALSSWLFLIGIFYCWQKQQHLQDEEGLLEAIFLPEELFTRNKLEDLVRTVPEDYKETMIVRRFFELLQGAMYGGSDLIRLNGELSRRDVDEIERGHIVLTSLKNLIPVVGFLGTVLGLSIGMVQFPDVADIDAMRGALKGFAVSLSIAFNTTLLALAYNIVLILLTSFIKQSEQDLVGELDKYARALITRIKLEVDSGPMPREATQTGADEMLANAVTKLQNCLISEFRTLGEKLLTVNAGANEQLAASLKETAQAVKDFLTQINEGVQRKSEQPVESSKEKN